MAISLSKGQNVSLSKEDPSLKNVGSLGICVLTTQKK